MDLALSQTEQDFLVEVQTFLSENLPQRLKDGMAATPGVFTEPDIGLEWQQILHAKGWLAYYWPAEYGGMDWSPIQKYLFERECALARAPKIAGMGLKLLGPIICAYGTDEQKDRVLPRILSGEDLWCQGFSETGAGSDLSSLKTKAVREGDKYIINGAKIWTTHAHHSTHIFCLVRTSNEEKQQNGISFVLVDMDQPGVSVRPIISLSGDHEVNEVFFDNAETGIENLVGEEGNGWSIAKFLLQNERGGTCFAPALIAALDRIRTYSASASNGHGSSLSQDQTFAKKLKRLELVAQGLEMTELRVLSDLAKGGKPGPATSFVKLIASNLRQEIDQLAMDSAGYAGLQLETIRPLYGNNVPEAIQDKHAQLAAPNYLNSRAWTIFGGTNEVQRTIIAKSVLSM